MLMADNLWQQKLLRRSGSSFEVSGGSVLLEGPIGVNWMEASCRSTAIRVAWWMVQKSKMATWFDEQCFLITFSGWQ